MITALRYSSLFICTNTFSDYLEPLVLIAMNTGLRRGELLNFAWADISFQVDT
ncbi:hypothetical protein [Photobacterium indicum]|uniref:hypothetical protein n=1 Tax=Photobacterium indicum TaxID=81447 RepID=UPI003D11820F